MNHLSPTTTGRRRAERGAELVEFALVAPLLIGIVFAVVDFGYMWNFRDRLTNATTTAARTYAVATSTGGQSAASAQSAARATIASAVNLPASTSFTFCVGDGSTCGGQACPVDGSSSDLVTLTVTAEAPSLTRFFASSFNITTKAIAPCS